MTEFDELQHAAAQMFESNEGRKWLFTHTYSQDEYLRVRRAMKVLAEFRPVRWEGKPGERHAVEV